MPNCLSCFASSTPKSTPPQSPIDTPLSLSQSSSPLNATATAITTNPNITTSIYRTDLAHATLSWVRTGLRRRSTHIDLQFAHPSLHFHLLFNPFSLWRKQGSKKLNLENSSNTVHVFWDLTKAKFVSSPEPQSGFYIAVVIDDEMALLVGDREFEAYAKTRAKKPELGKIQNLIFRREHVFGRELFEFKSEFGGEVRDLSIDCCVIDGEFVLGFNFDKKRLVQVRRLEWKFRGAEVVEFEGVRVHLSWDVYNWLFEEGTDAPAMFSFRFDRIKGFDCDEIGSLWREISGSEDEINVVFKKKKRNYKSTIFDTRSSSSSSISSSFSSNCNSSVLEWTSSEEAELQSGSTEFNLVIFAWKV